MWRLVTRDGEAVDDLYSDADRYVRLIHALHELLPDDLGAIADRVLAGSSFDAKRYTKINEAELIYRALRKAGACVSQKYRLLRDCQEISYIRSVTDEALLDGSVGVPAVCDSAALQEEMGRHWPLLEFPISIWHENSQQLEVRKSLNAFWSHDPKDFGPWAAAVNGICGEDLLYFPHCYLGEVLSPETAQIIDLQARVDRTRLRVVGAEKVEDPLKPFRDDQLPSITFDEQSKRYVVGDTDDGLTWGVKATWLLLYPSPDLTELLPALFQPGAAGFGLGYLLPLSPAVIAEFADDTAWWYLHGGNATSMYERVRQLVTIGPDGVPTIEEAWMDTAKRFRFNPIHRNYRPDPWMAAIEKYLREDN